MSKSHPTILAGSANRPLAEAVSFQLGVDLCPCSIERFPNDEMHVMVGEPVRDRHVFLIQPTSPPVAVHALELLLLADACRRSGVDKVTGIIPYYGYARQDRRVNAGEPVSARLLADLLGLKLDQVVFLDLHNPAIEGFFTIPVEHLSAVPLLAETLRTSLNGNCVIVAPDLGAVKLAQRYAELLELPVAYVHKIRRSSRDVNVHSVIGDVQSKTAVVVDDMINTGGTVVSAIEALVERGCADPVRVVVSHGLLVDDAAPRLASLPVRVEMISTDSVKQDEGLDADLKIVSLAPMLGSIVMRLHTATS